jgi:hypothetical protein
MMPGKYTYRLTAEGFAEFQAQLAKLGDAGVAAFDRIKSTMPQFADAASKAEARAAAAKQKLEDMARTDFSRLAASLDPVIAKQQQLAEGQETIARARSVGVIGVQEEAKALALLEQNYGATAASASRYSEALGKMGSLLGTLGIGVSLGALVQFSRGVFETTAALDNQAKTLGISVEQFQAYHGAAILAGAAADTGDLAIQRFTRSLGESNKAFLELGLSADDLAGGTAAALPKVAQALLQITDVSTRARIEVELFGKSGQEVEQVLEQWGDPDVLQHMRDMGLVIDQELTKRAEAADRAFSMLWQHIKVGSAEVLFGGPSAGQSAVKNLLGNPADIGLGQALPFANSSTQAMVFAQSGAARVSSDMTAFYQVNGKAFADAERAREDANKKALEDQKKFDEEIQGVRDASDQTEAEALQATSDQIEALKSDYYQREAEAAQEFEDKHLDIVTVGESRIEKYLRDQRLKAIDDQAREEERAALQSEHYWDRMFDNMFQSGHLNFKKLLADIATEAIARPIIVPVITQFAGAIGLGGLGQTGGIFSGAGFGNTGALLGSSGGAGGLGGLGSLGGLLGSGGMLGSAGSIANGNVGTGLLGFLDGTSNSAAALGGITSFLGPAAIGLGIGSFTGGLTGGANGGVASSIGGALGGIAGSFLGPLGTMAGAAIGGAIGGLIDGKPSNYTAYANFGADYSILGGATGDKPNGTTVGLAQQAGSAIATAAKSLEAAGVTLTGGVQRLEIGQRDQSRLLLASGQRVNIGAKGDVQGAVSGTLNYLLGGASSSNAGIQAVLGKYQAAGGNGNIDQLIADVNNAAGLAASLSSGAVPHQLTAVETAMKALTDAFAATAKQARSLGLDVTNFAATTRRAFDSDILDSITAIQDPLKAALDLWQRDAQARLNAAATVGGDISQVSTLNNLLHKQIIGQFYGNTVSSLQGLQSGILFGSSSANSIDRQFFAAQTQFNTTKRTALGSLDPTDIASFETAAQAFLPIARDFLGTSERFAAITGDVQDTISQLLGGISNRENGPDLTPLVEATNNGSAAVVDAVNGVNDAVQSLTATVADQAGQIRQLNASTNAIIARYSRGLMG